jgi:transcriptional regulator with GAF, ATPase, and Fis domain
MRNLTRHGKQKWITFTLDIKQDIESFPSLDEAMAHHIQSALRMARGKVDGKGGAAEYLKINPRTLRHRMKKLGIPFGRKVKHDFSR